MAKIFLKGDRSAVMTIAGFGTLQGEINPEVHKRLTERHPELKDHFEVIQEVVVEELSTEETTSVRRSRSTDK